MHFKAFAPYYGVIMDKQTGWLINSIDFFQPITDVYSGSGQLTNERAQFLYILYMESSVIFIETDQDKVRGEKQLALIFSRINFSCSILSARMQNVQK